VTKDRPLSFFKKNKNILNKKKDFKIFYRIYIVKSKKIKKEGIKT